MTRRPFVSLARRLTRTVLWWAMLCALLVGLGRAVFIFQAERATFAHSLDEVGSTTVPLLSVLVWDIEPEAVQRQLDLLVQREQIGWVRLEVDTGQTFVSGVPQPNSPMVRRFVVPVPGSDTARLAQLTVQGDMRTLWLAVARGLAAALGGLTLVTLLICAVVSWAVHRHFVRPLRQVAAFAEKLTPQNLTEPLIVRRPLHRGEDEIDRVVHGFAVLQRGLRAHIEELDARVAQRTQDLEQALCAIRELAMRDPLTGCFTRQVFNERMGQEVQRAHRYGRALSVLFVDADHFKRINDSHGHQAGDAAIAAIGAALRAGLRQGVDWVARYGGEEFVVVLPETDIRAASDTAERLRARLAATEVPAGAVTLRLTVSIGVATLRAGESQPDLLHRADAQLYAAKHAGRNRVCVDAG